jgi:hypothetical protein
MAPSFSDLLRLTLMHRLACERGGVLSPDGDGDGACSISFFLETDDRRNIISCSALTLRPTIRFGDRCER